MTIKLVAIDIDGTLVNNNREITPEVFDAVQQAKAAGVKIVIATGRPLLGVKNILSALNLLEAGNYVITYNGALVQATDTGEAFIDEPLTYEDYLDIETESRRLETPLHSITMRAIYTHNRNISKYTVNEAYITGLPLKYRTAAEMSGKEIVKMMYIDEPEKLDETISKLPTRFTERYNIVKSTPFYLEILNKNASKGLAVQHLAEKLGISHEETMAIGDEENDRSMLEAVGTPVVMANGNPELKKIAKHITKSNDESGVAHAINEWVLN
ncbi:sugar phosphate phosphatase [Lactococcus hodotermopsidis]|uniref:Sugar phosphate phosphatase n=1 Tax=Pseudolactococcus hodotermopsidis TaxID=2709157 RepID=A0A6A0B8Q6_9LACT|nr:sugar-phosphatase [Lactococcus hodotermopsidis]GFH41789.1 sugar phosphate phosphatase [Lactococcus hodotermopsidis]